MRILFTFAGGNGHFEPLAPLANAARASGEEVLFSCQPAMLGRVAAAGFAAVDSGGPTLALPWMRGPLVPVDRDHEAQVIREVFAGTLARERAARLLSVAAGWRADVIVRDEVDFGAAVAAERLRIPHVSVVVLAAGGLIGPDLVAAPLDDLRAHHGLPADPQLGMLHRHLTLVPVPPSFRTPKDRLPTVARHLRPAVLEQDQTDAVHAGPVARTLSWLASRPGRPTIYLTLGTVFHQESGDLFQRVLKGLASVVANIVVTVGGEIDPAELGEQPTHVHVERFVAQRALLPRCSAVISHAGSGSVIGALAFGVPLVLLPMGADQPWNADRCQDLGVAQVLNPVTATPAAIHAAVSAVLSEPHYRRSARRLADEIRQLPTSTAALQRVRAVVPS